MSVQHIIWAKNTNPKRQIRHVVWDHFGFGPVKVGVGEAVALLRSKRSKISKEKTKKELEKTYLRPQMCLNMLFEPGSVIKK